MLHMAQSENFEGKKSVVCVDLPERTFQLGVNFLYASIAMTENTRLSSFLNVGLTSDRPTLFQRYRFYCSVLYLTLA